MPRIAMVINMYYPFVGGNERQCELLSEELVRRGSQVDVVTTWLPGMKLYEKVNGVRVFRVLTPVWSRLFWPTVIVSNAVLLLFLLVSGRKYDIIHAHQALWHALAAVTACKMLNRRSVVKVAGGGASGNVKFWLDRSITGSWAIKKIRMADAIVSVSEEIINELSSVGIKENVTNISNGVKVSDEQGYEKGEEITDSMSEYDNLTVYVGRLSEEKGVDTLVKAWVDVVREEKKAGLIIVGDGPQRNQLHNYAREQGLEKNILFVGAKKNVENYLRAADVFVLPSRGEGMSNALLEAMAVGLPCVVSDIGGNVRLVNNGETGLTFPSESDISLAVSIINVLRDKALAQKLGENARNFIKSNFSVDIITDKYLRLYNRLLME